MRLTASLAVVGAAVCLALAVTPPVSAAPAERTTVHFEFDSSNDCGDGLLLEFHDIVDQTDLVVYRGNGTLPYLTQHWDLTAVATIPGTDQTITVVNKGVTWHDVRVTDNGDGTYTARAISPARIAVLGPDGRTESHFSGLSAVEQVWNDAGTPGDLDDDVLESEEYTSHGHLADEGVCEVARRYYTP